MRRRNNHAYHDLSQPKAAEPPAQQDWAPPNPFEDYQFPEPPEVPHLPEEAEVYERLNSLQINNKKSGAGKLIDQIPGPELPYTLGISSHSREPVPEIPEERELAQAAVDEGNEGKFRTFQDSCPPPADTMYTIVDQGVSGPDFFRCSMYNVPASEKLRKQSQLPLSVFLRPFAEAEVPLADLTQFSGENMPPRCQRCRAYMNPSMRFINGGSKFVCNLCGFVNHTPDEYYQPTGPDGRRIDWEERPELAFGTYDFSVVPAEDVGDGLGTGHVNGGSGSDSGNNPSLSQQPALRDYTLANGLSGLNTTAANAESVYGKPAKREFRRIFCCECGRDAIQKDILALFAESVIASLPYLGKEERIAIMTFDSHINYFRLNANGGTQMLVSSPNCQVVPPDVFVDPHEKREELVNMLERLPGLFEETSDRNSCFGSALESIFELPNIKEGGRVTAMFSSLPSVGPSKLMVRDKAIAGVTSPDSPVHKELFEPSSSFYKQLVEKFTQNGWGCDLLAIPTTGYLDVPNLGKLAENTGGSFYYYPRFMAERDSRRVVGDVLSIISAPMQARNASVKIRTSTGIQIDKIYGSGDGNASFLHSDSTFVATVTYDGQLDPKLDAHFQAAVLYTAPSGDKRVRVFNILTGVTSKFKSVVKFVHSDVVLATIVRQTLSQMGKHLISDLRQAVLNKIEHIFGAARLYAGQGMPLTQLLMPTNLRQLPMLALSLTKSIALGSRAFSSDAREVNAIYLRQSLLNQQALALYPRIYDVGTKHSAEIPSVRARFQDLMLGSHVFLVFDGQQMYLWLGESVSPSTLYKLFGVRKLENVSPWLSELPEIESELSEQARKLCHDLAIRVNRSWLPVQIVRQRLDGAEYQLRQLMVEDTINDSPSYINYVVRLHHLAKEYNDKEGWF